VKSKAFFLFIFLSAITLHAQPYKIKRLGIEQGISNNYVVSITQDKRGFLWFATESGLNKFDGNGFKVYKKNKEFSTKSISGNELNKVYADALDNTIWIATQRDGLNRFDCQTETFHFYQYNPGNPSGIITNDITDITNASDGNLWISTYHKGVEYFDKKKESFIHYNTSTISGWVSDNVWSVREDKKGFLYIGHVSSGLSVFSLKDKKVIHFQHDPTNPESLPGNEVRTIYVDKTDNIWIGTNNGLALFNADKETFTVFRHEPDNPKSLIANSIYSITQLSDGRLWVGTEMGGVSILNISQNMFSSPREVPFINISQRDDESGFSNQTIRSIFQDSFNNIWIGTYGGGVNFISHRTPFFNTWEYSPLPGINNRLNDKTAWGICADNQDRLWVGTDGGGINLFENGKRTAVFKKETKDLTDNAILAAIKDSEGNLWFGTFNGGVNVYDSRKKTFTHPNPTNGSREIRCFYEDNDKNMWIGSNGGLYVYNLLSGNTGLYTTRNSKLAEELVRSIAKDKEGKIWVGFFGQGLSVFDSGFRLIEDFKTEKGFPSNEVNYIYKDLKGQMWVGTGEGLVCFAATSASDSLKYRIFDEKNGLANSHIRAIAEDGQQNLWISTDGGISRYIPDQDKFYNYDHFTGIPVGNFMSGSVSKTSDGMLFFGSQNGVCYFNPAQIPTEIQLPATVITEFKIYNNQVGLPDNEISVPVAPVIKLAYNQNTFNVSFNVLDYSLNHLVEHAYMLSGAENLWYNTQGENSVTFRNIPPGTYELKIHSRIKNQEWPDEITSLRIVIHPPFWLTWWAKLIYGLAIFAIVFFILSFYKRKLNLENTLILEKRNHQQEQELNDERLRFFTNITHELRTPLTLILGPLEDLSRDAALPEKYSSKISLIHKSATRLLNLITQLLEFRKTETQNKKLCVSKGNLTELVQEVGLKYKELNANKAISFHIFIETQKPFVYFDPDIITSIIDNLLSNAFKYTEKGTISLILREVKEQQDYMEIEVKDTGRGISAEALPKIFNRYYQAEKEFQASGTGIGLALVKNLVEIHQGSVLVDSQPGEGTSFRFRILTNNTYPNALHADAESKNKPSPEEKETGEAPDGKQIVLVVEDNEEIRNYITDSLSENYKVYAANNGKRGLEEAFAHIPDIIVSDIMMPEMDGFELSKRLKEDVRTSHIPIILLTAKDTIQDRTEGYAIGVESYITKPFSAGLLQSRILNLLESRRKIAELIHNNTANKNALMIDSLSQLDNEFIEQITAIVEQNLDSDRVDVEFIADKMCMSHSTLYRKIKALSGMSANEFIRKVRIRNAEQLLLTGKYTISEISYMVGINSITYFRQCFKEEFGLAPSEYVKQIMNN
jgi:signal transduction histidine kinase/ligand-binding sensor domain-containing protein/AraC-like DNA-binding protein